MVLWFIFFSLHIYGIQTTSRHFDSHFALKKNYIVHKLDMIIGSILDLVERRWFDYLFLQLKIYLCVIRKAMIVSAVICSIIHFIQIVPIVMIINWILIYNVLHPLFFNFHNSILMEYHMHINIYKSEIRKIIWLNQFLKSELQDIVSIRWIYGCTHYHVLKDDFTVR